MKGKLKGKVWGVTNHGGASKGKIVGEMEFIVEKHEGVVTPLVMEIDKRKLGAKHLVHVISISPKHI